MKINLQKIIAPTIFTTVFTFAVSIGCWLLFYFLRPMSEPMSGSAGAFVEKILPSSSFAAYAVSLGLALLTAFLIAQFNNRYAYVNTRTFLPTFVFLLLSTSWISTHGHSLFYAAALCVLFAVYLFFGNYNNNNGTEIAFLGFIFLGTSIFIVPEYVFLVPFMWIGFFNIKSLSFRTFFASLLGFLVPWFFIYGFIYLKTNQLAYYPDFIFVFDKLHFYSLSSIPMLVYAGLITVIFIILRINSISQLNRDAIKTRKLLFFFQALIFGIILLMIFYFNHFTAYLPLAAAVLAVLSTYTFTVQRTLTNSILFIALCVVSGLYILYQLFF